MKLQTTAKRVRETNSIIIKLGYCRAQYLLKYITPSAYTAGVYGWNADIYYINNICICSGYRPFGNIQPNYELIQKYETAAEKIANDYKINWEERKQKINYLLTEFVREVTR